MMSIIAFLRNIDIFYCIPIIIFVMGAITWSVLGCIKIYQFIQKPVLEIIYDNGSYNEIVKVPDGYGYYDQCLAYRFAVYNYGNTEIKNVTVLMEQNTLSDLPSFINCSDSENKQKTQDLPSNCLRIYDIYYMMKALPDRLKGISVKITVKGEKMKAITQTITL